MIKGGRAKTPARNGNQETGCQGYLRWDGKGDQGGTQLQLIFGSHDCPHGKTQSIQGARDSKEEILKIFKLFDEDNLNKITFKNLKRIAAEVGEKIPDDELKEMLEEADRDGDGMLNFEEFYRIMRRRGDPLDDFDSDDEWFLDRFMLELSPQNK